MLPSSMLSSTNDADTAVLVGSSLDFPEGRGKQIDVGAQRTVAIMRYQGTLFAIDHYCYHMGGPLANGDIEELTFTSKTGTETSATHTCVTCPWHKYTISLQTGEALYRPVVPKGMKSKPAIQSKGVKQRIHQVWETDDHEVYVRINNSTQLKYESDRYASEEFRELMSRRGNKK